MATDPVHPSGLPYRPGVGIMLLNPAGEVFVAKRLDNPADYWQMPQGGIDEGEDPRAAAFRELEEETSIRDADILAETDEWLCYDLPDHLVGRMWSGRYCGQKQRWYAMRFTGRDDDIDIETTHPEFSDWRWARRGSLPSLIVPFKRQLYRDVLAAFADIG